MFDQCLIIFFIIGSHNVVVGGQGQYYPDTTTTTTAGVPTSTSMTTEKIAGYYDFNLTNCGFGLDGLCAWKNDPGANRSWRLNPLYEWGARMMGEMEKSAFIYYDEPSPRGNSSARLISPLYSRDLDKDGCFSTSFKIYTNPQSRSAGIRVYQRPDYIALEDLLAYSDEAKKDYILFEVWGDWDDYWYEKQSTLKKFDRNFQIILEGINFGEDPMYMGIEYVSIDQRSACHGDTVLTRRSTTSTSTTTSTTRSTTTMSTTTIQEPLGIRFGTWDEFRCNFNNVDFCGWKNDPAADDEWFLSTNDKNFEDFYSSEGSEWYLYFNKASSSGNGTVRLISPLYSRVLKGSCFHFAYRIRTASHGRSTGIRVYIKPEYLPLEDLLAYNYEEKKDFVLYDIWGEQYWSWNETKMMNVDYNFQIIIEGIYGQDNIYMALDDVIISGYPDCTPSTTPTTSSSTTTSTTTTTTPRSITTTSLRPTTTTFSPLTKEGPLGVTDSLSCDFEAWGLCGWKNDPKANGFWGKVSNLDPNNTFLSADLPLYTAVDRRLGNRIARLISPLYSRELERSSCFYFSYMMFIIYSHDSFLGIRVYQKPAYLAVEDLVASSDEAKKDYIIFENLRASAWSPSPSWCDGESPLKHFYDNFQIIIEGIFTEGVTDRLIAIDNVAIRQRSQCTTTTTAVPTTTSTTTTPRSTTTTIFPPTTTQRLRGGLDSGNIQLMSIIAFLGLVMLTLIFILAAVLARQRGKLNALRANIVDTSFHHVEHEKKPPEVRFSTKDGEEVVIHCNESNKQNGYNQEIDN